MGPFWLVDHTCSSTSIDLYKGSDNPTDETSSHEEDYEEVVPVTIIETQQTFTGTEITMTEPRKLDKYGFIVNMDSSGNVFDNGEEDAKDRIPTFVEAKRTERREKKWNTTLAGWDRRRPRKLLKRLRKGIPDSVRGRVWVLLGGGIRQPGLYEEILQKTSDAMLENFKELATRGSLESSHSSNPTSPRSSSDTSSSPASEEKPNNGRTDDSSMVYEHTRHFRSVQDTIERDIHRTFPRHNLFFDEDPHAKDAPPSAEYIALGGCCDPELAAMILNLESDIHITASGGTSKPLSNSDDIPGGQAALRRVLRAYSYYDREIGYCQGMNFIAGMFLTLMSEEEAFWLLVATMHEKPCEMRGMFGEGMRETHKVLHVAERLTHHYLPKLAKHFDKENIHVTMYATQWLLTQYTSSFKFDLVTRVWDCFLGEGWKTIYRVMLALLQQWQAQLLKMSFEEILAFFRELPDRVEGHVVMETALRIPLRTKVIQKYEKEWYAKQSETSR